MLLLRPEREWYRGELARELGTPTSSLQRPLASLAHADILTTREDGNRHYYRANTENPIYPELRGLLVKTSGLVGVVRSALEPHRTRIVVAFIFGAIASGKERAASDVDLLVVGAVGLRELVGGLREAANKLGREINPVVYSEVEFHERVRGGNHFLKTVLDRPRLPVIGTEDDIQRIV